MQGDMHLEEAENITNPTLHSVPVFFSDYNGPAAVSKYFVIEKDPKNPDVLESSFRGRELKGQELTLPYDYAGIIVEEPEARSKTHRKDEEEDEHTDKLVAAEEKTWKIQGRFSKFTYWNRELTPASYDKQNKWINEWSSIAAVLHEPLTQEEVDKQTLKTETAAAEATTTTATTATTSTTETTTAQEESNNNNNNSKRDNNNNDNNKENSKSTETEAKEGEEKEIEVEAASKKRRRSNSNGDNDDSSDNDNKTEDATTTTTTATTPSKSPPSSSTTTPSPSNKRQKSGSGSTPSPKAATTKTTKDNGSSKTSPSPRKGKKKN